MLNLILPPHALLESAAAELINAAQASGDTKRQIALSKALYDLLMGAEIIAVAGGFLLPSSTRSGLVHRFDNATGACTCEAGQHGRQCRHATAIEIIEHAQQRNTMPNLTDRAAKLAAAQAAADALNGEW